MRSGSSAQGGDNWPPAQRPYPDEASSGPVQYGPGPRSDPQQDAGRRRDVPFGPEISWPNGFRQLDQRTRDVFESAYAPEPVYQQPAIDDYGYGDPGYADPSYDGPRTPAAPPAFGTTGSRQAAAPMPGYRLPETRDYSRPGYLAPEYEAPGHQAPGYEAPGYAVPGHEVPGYGASGGYAASGPQAFAAPTPGVADIYPVTGAQEALPDTGPQPAARPWAGQDAGARPAPGGPAYPEQWYDHPRLEDQVSEDQAPGRRPAADPRQADPRLQGMRYDELRYDEPSTGAPRIEESPDDESWFADLRRNTPAFPRDLPGQPPQAATPQPQPAPSAPWTEPQRPSYQQAPAAERFGGYGPGLTGLSGSSDRGGSGPQLSAGNQHQMGPRTGGSQPAFGRGPAASAPSAPFAFLGAPTVAAPTLDAPAAQVGVLTSPADSRVDDLQNSGPRLTSPFPASPALDRPADPATPVVRPGHGLDGPEITSSWPAQPAVDEADSFAEFWAEDNDNAEYSGLFGERDTVPEGPRTGVKRTIGRRRGRSNDHRLWLGLGGVVIIAAAAITGIIKFEFPAHGGPTHSMATPPKIGTYVRTVDLERQTNVAQLRDEVIKMSAGQASLVKSAVYESGNSAAGNTEQIVMFIGGHLANAAPATSVASFTQKFSGAHVVSAGALGGKAVCVEEGGTSNSVSMCAWFDNDSFGEIVSPTMNASALSQEMLTLRPAVETVVKK
jgi:hypothetical protein